VSSSPLLSIACCLVGKIDSLCKNSRGQQFLFVCYSSSASTALPTCSPRLPAVRGRTPQVLKQQSYRTKLNLLLHHLHQVKLATARGSTVVGSCPSPAMTAVQVELRPPSSPSAAPIEHPHSENAISLSDNIMYV
uniref:Uncharacterized protein n=1 Tax=Aegilops tauschii subsp. strangulata TaxID=200361 RepID=A0A453BM70_AEGTS